MAVDGKQVAQQIARISGQLSTLPSAVNEPKVTNGISRRNSFTTPFSGTHLKQILVSATNPKSGIFLTNIDISGQ